MDADPAERRDGDRMAIPDLHLEIATIGEQGQVEVSTGRCACLDLSSGGMQVITHQMLEPGRRYGFRLGSPRLARPNWFIGKVRWGCETEDGEIRAGISFESLEPTDRAVLVQLLQPQPRSIAAHS